MPSACFGLGHDAKEVLAHDEAYVLFRKASLEEMACEVDDLGSVCQSGNPAVPVEIRAESDVFNAHYPCSMTEMIDGIEYRCFSRGTEESLIDCCLCHAIVLG